MNTLDQKPKSGSILKFIILSFIGGFLFLALLPFTTDGGYRSFNIPLGFAIEWLRDDVFANITFGDFSAVTFAFHHMLALIAISLSFLGSLLAYLAKPKFIMENEKIKGVFYCHPIYFLSRAFAFVVAWMVFLGRGPDAIIASFTGDEMMSLTAGLVVIFIFLGPTIPLLTDFGLMEFIGTIIRRIVRVLFTLPGRSAVDLIASWFGSSAAGIIITREQHEQGFYTNREAAVIATNFSLVSLPFTFVIASLIDMQAYFLRFYLVICIVSVVLAFVMPRLWPLRGIADTYLAGVGKQIAEETPRGTSIFSHAVSQAAKKAEKTSAGDVVRTGAMSYLTIFMDLIPLILAWGTLALMLHELTPVFTWLSWPFGAYLSLLRVEYAFEYAPAALVGFADMYIPGLLIGDAPFHTRFVLGVLSIVQIVYMAETGALIIKSKIPLGIGRLFIIFLMRTIIALPIIVLLTNLLL